MPTFPDGRQAMGVCAVLIAAVVSAQVTDGLEATAETSSREAFVAVGESPQVDRHEDALGDARLSVQNLINGRDATYGDRGLFEARIDVGLDTWEIEALTVGAPPVVMRDGDETRAMPSSLRFAWPTAGGV